MNSVAQNAHQTPSAPMTLLKRKANGIITIIYRRREIYRDGVPFPRPSRAPEQVTDTAETTKPRLIIRRAHTPFSKVVPWSVNNPISHAGTAQDRIVPTAITPAVRARVVWNISLTLPFSPAP